MMKFFINREVNLTILLMLAVSFAAFMIAYGQDEGTGWFVLAVCLLLTAMHTVSTFLRYRRISGLAADVDRILHGKGYVALDKYAEGELGILHSEIFKMTTRLRENEQRLLTDKQYLADSLADISHQLRTPLTSINLLVSLLAEPDISSERRQTLTRELNVLLSRIDWLISTLLKISKLDAGTVQFNRSRIPLAELIRRSCEPVLIPMELRDQTLQVDVGGDFWGDLSWSCEAIGNIVKNCMEHTPNGGRIEVHGVDNALYTEIVVRDNGGGIDPKDMPHIFERFYKGKNADEKSFGIGLALARMIVTAQNGTVKAENTGSGAMFTLRFYKGTI